MKKVLLLFLILTPLLLYGYVSVAAAQGTLPDIFDPIWAVPGGDKAGHFVVMGMISVVITSVARIWSPYRKRMITTILTALALILLFTAEEFSQRYIPTRTFSLKDLYFSYGGACTGVILAILFTLRKPKEALTQ